MARMILSYLLYKYLKIKKYFIIISINKKWFFSKTIRFFSSQNNPFLRHFATSVDHVTKIGICVLIISNNITLNNRGSECCSVQYPKAINPLGNDLSLSPFHLMVDSTKSSGEHVHGWLRGCLNCSLDFLKVFLEC